jgi:threonine/homoserine/homoserine lactone efflux protein
MTDAFSYVVPAFLLGFALGAAPGPVQVLILSQTARRGFSGGLRVMLGANGTLFVVMVVLALGVSALQPSEAVLRILRVAGGAFLIYLGVVELRRVVAEHRAGGTEPAPDGRLGPTALGIVSVVLNPGAWIFFATTAASIVASASAEGGRSAAIVAAVATTLGVSASDLTFTLIGSGGRRAFGDHGLRVIRGVLAGLLIAIGLVFVVQGLLG